MKIVILESAALDTDDLSWDGFYALGEVTKYSFTPREKAAERIGDAEIVIISKLAFDGQLMDLCPKLKYIGVLATGYNNVDVKAATERGITVTNIPAYSTPSVVQHTFALLLELCVHAETHSLSVMSGKWGKNPTFWYQETPLMELSGKTMGIIGFGAIGQGVARVAASFGMKVLSCAAHKREDSGIAGVEMTGLDEIIAQSDVISLHCPLTEESKNLICTETLAKMRDGVIIINTARGGLVCEQDVAQALISGKLGGFGSDVLSHEPPVNGSPLFGMPNCIITPHIAWAPIESRRRLMDSAVGNVRAFIDGNPQNTVKY